MAIIRRQNGEEPLPSELRPPPEQDVQAGSGQVDPGGNSSSPRVIYGENAPSSLESIAPNQPGQPPSMPSAQPSPRPSPPSAPPSLPGGGGPPPGAGPQAAPQRPDVPTPVSSQPPQPFTPMEPSMSMSASTQPLTAQSTIVRRGLVPGSAGGGNSRMLGKAGGLLGGGLGVPGLMSPGQDDMSDLIKNLFLMANRQ